MMSNSDINYRTKCLLEKDEICVICGTTDNVIAHHINGDRGDDRLENLVPMCQSCHRKVHSPCTHGDPIDRYTDLLPEESINKGPYSRINKRPKNRGPKNMGGRTSAKGTVDVNERGRITIPQPIRKALGFDGEGATIELTVRYEDDSTED